jgi:hypothetical protein
VRHVLRDGLANPREEIRLHELCQTDINNKNQPQAVDLWTMRLRRTGELTVDNATRYTLPTAPTFVPKLHSLLSR